MLEKAKPEKSKSAKPKPKPAASKSPSPEEAEPELQNAQHTPEETQPPPTESFESYYLKRVTAEFADDIDKIRNASDFNERSVPVLVQALKQTAANFTEEEKERVMGRKR